MDPLFRMLSSLRAQGLFALRLSMTAPWSVDIDDGAPLTVIAVDRGAVWLAGSGQPVRLVAGQVALVAHGPRYVVADAPQRPPTVRIIEGGVCIPLSETMRSTAHRGLLTWGNDDDGADQLLVGTYARVSQVGHHLTEQLRDITVPPPGSVDETLLALLRSELADPKPGHSFVIDRLLDVVVASVIRAAAPLAGPGWLSGTVDPTVAGALDLMHESPEKPWSVTSLAAAMHVSRSGLAAKFRDGVGETPARYLARWRMTLAADALIATDDGLETIARRVGYGSAYSFSNAFKSVHGQSPAHYRLAHR
ncbi:MULTISPECIES: AraC family transcriptional regulator [unclassified Gordonia (in: high G+C Gram-positive bacteria)]|uniref:AraC family transcriptional regulator n=1 Tax=unclassified Gordonia (in: high G+C Gram-positive bacteria) TaxID=2657482 RepID=UPI00209B291B|nr:MULTISPECIES: AraC family transcriptional regulator [unclassified Gordonia (in: high G+C Gram-positive bacteria)]MDF3284759.1 AraC family transcriptional regulator [Gordonia sp. N1V]